MPRLIRIALTFFASATILTILIWQRVARLQSDLQYVDGEVARELTKQETEMVSLGVILAGGLACAGFVLIIVEIYRAKRRTADHEG